MSTIPPSVPKSVHMPHHRCAVFILCVRNWHDYLACPISNSIGTGKTSKKNCGKSASNIGLYGNKSKCNSWVLRIRHDLEHALRCIIFVCRPRKKQGRRIFFPRKSTKRRQSYSAKWQYSHHMHNSHISSGIRSRGRIRSIISQRPRSKNYSFNVIGIRSPTAPYTNPCRQHYSGGNSQQYNQAPTVTGNKNKIFLASQSEE